MIPIIVVLQVESGSSAHKGVPIMRIDLIDLLWWLRRR
jgi:hypothetical protein